MKKFTIFILVCLAFIFIISFIGLIGYYTVANKYRLKSLQNQQSQEVQKSSEETLKLIYQLEKTETAPPINIETHMKTVVVFVPIFFETMNSMQIHFLDVREYPIKHPNFQKTNIVELTFVGLEFEDVFFLKQMGFLVDKISTAFNELENNNSQEDQKFNDPATIKQALSVYKQLLKNFTFSSEKIFPYAEKYYKENNKDLNLYLIKDFVLIGYFLGFTDLVIPYIPENDLKEFDIENAQKTIQNYLDKIKDKYTFLPIEDLISMDPPSLKKEKEKE